MSQNDATPATGRIPEPLETQVRRRTLSALGAPATADPGSLELLTRWDEGYEVDGGREFDRVTLEGHWRDAAPWYPGQTPEDDGTFAGHGGIENEDIARLVVDLATAQTGAPKATRPADVLLRALLDHVGAPDDVDMDLAMCSFAWEEEFYDAPAEFVLVVQWRSTQPQWADEAPDPLWPELPYRHHHRLTGLDAAAALSAV